jgi:nucleoside-diphosphate-sugar epimerase
MSFDTLRSTIDSSSSMTNADRAKSVLVVGATGATGRLVVRHLLGRGLQVRAVARPATTLPRQLDEQPGLSVIRANLLELNDTEIADLISGCDAVVSCMGHNLKWKGVFGNPRRLVRNTVYKLSDAAIARNPERPIQFVLMNSAGCRNQDASETVSPAHRAVIALIRTLVPPHADNEQAADHLRTTVGRSNPAMTWVVVRPDSLIDEDKVTDYSIHTSPTRSAIFDPGSTSRINVAHFMADLIMNDYLWHEWEGQMPVIYNK